MSSNEKNIGNTEPNFKSKIQQKMVQLGIYAAILLVVFLIGLVPMWLSARNYSTELDKTKTQLRKAEIHNILTTSIVESRRGEYESARKAVSDFYTQLRSESDKGDSGFLTADQREKIKPIFENRDQTITMLAQRDQSSNDRLNELYNNFTQVVPMNSVAAEVPKASPAQ